MNSKKPLKIAYIVRKYSTSGGTERHIFTITKKISELGHKVFIICSKSEVKPPNSNIKIFKIPSNFPSRTIKTYLFYLFTKMLNIEKYDIVQGAGKVVNHHIYRAGGGFHKLYLKYQKKRDNLTFYDKMVMKIEKEIYNINNTRLIISVSNFIKNEIEKEFGYPSDKIIVLHNCIDLEFFYPTNEKTYTNTLKCLFVANDYKLKGLKNILSAIIDIENIELLIVGNDNINSFIEIAKNYNILEKVKFLGEKRGKELLKIYQECDILLHPTYFDPFSNVCLEAMACGLPVVTTKINGASEIIDNYKDGIVIKHSEDITGIKEAILYFKNKDNLLKSRDYAINKAKNYSLDKYVENLLDIYFESQKIK